MVGHQRGCILILRLKFTLGRGVSFLVDTNVYVSLLICILKGFLSDEGPLFYFMEFVNHFEYCSLVVNMCCKT